MHSKHPQPTPAAATAAAPPTATPFSALNRLRLLSFFLEIYSGFCNTSLPTLRHLCACRGACNTSPKCLNDVLR